MGDKKKKEKIERNYGGELSPDRVSYSEGVKISIGDYESRDLHCTMSTDVQHGEDPKQAIQRARRVVQERLKVGEKRIRQSAQDDVDFETMERLNYYK